MDDVIEIIDGREALERTKAALWDAFMADLERLQAMELELEALERAGVRVTVPVPVSTTWWR